MQLTDPPTAVRLARAALAHGLPVAASGAVLAAALACWIANPPLLQDVQLKVFDQFQRLRPRAYQPVPVRVIDLDDRTLARLGQWPWPRTLVARLVDRLAQLGAAAIAFDVVFAEPDRTSPGRLLPLWAGVPELDALRANAARLPDHDAVLARAFLEAPVVAGFALGAEATARTPTAKHGLSFGGDDPLQFLPRAFRGAIASLPELEAAASGNGCFNQLPERDGVIRRVPLFFRLGDAMYPSLAAEALRVAQGASTYVVNASGAHGEASFGEHTGIVSVRIGRLILPTDEQGRLWMHDTGPIPERMLPAWRLFEPDLDRDLIDGHIVFIGTSAAGLKDLRTTPRNPAAAGVEVHAQLVEQALAGEFLRRPDWARGVEMVYLLALGTGLTLLLPRVGALGCALLGAGAIAGACAGSWWAFTRRQWLLDPVFPSVMVLLIYLTASLIAHLRTEAERRRVRHAFGRYMSPVLVERLAHNPHLLKLGGEMRNMTLLFADIRGFTTISEQFDAEGLTRFINRFLTPMTEVILRHQGTIDKYMGDCIMAFWNAPLDDPEHARHGCRAALEMRDYLVEWNKRMTAEAEAAGATHHPIHVGIGLNTGDCCVGNMGSDQRFDYSVIGDDVNLASRLEGQSKTYGADIVLGPATAERVADHAVLELDLLQVKGKTKAVRIFALLRDEAFAAQPDFQALRAAHAQMLAAYRAQRWAEALARLEACLALDTKYTRLRIFYALYRARIEAFQASPPAADWDGTTVATAK
jgi:adenylate cyclase